MDGLTKLFVRSKTVDDVVADLRSKVAELRSLGRDKLEASTSLREEAEKVLEDAQTKHADLMVAAAHNANECERCARIAANIEQLIE